MGQHFRAVNSEQILKLVRESIRDKVPGCCVSYRLFEHMNAYELEITVHDVGHGIPIAAVMDAAGGICTSARGKEKGISGIAERFTSWHAKPHAIDIIGSNDE